MDGRARCAPRRFHDNSDFDAANSCFLIIPALQPGGSRRLARRVSPRQLAIHWWNVAINRVYYHRDTTRAVVGEPRVLCPKFKIDDAGAMKQMGLMAATPSVRHRRQSPSTAGQGPTVGAHTHTYKGTDRCEIDSVWCYAGHLERWYHGTQEGGVTKAQGVIAARLATRSGSVVKMGYHRPPFSTVVS